MHSLMILSHIDDNALMDIGAFQAEKEFLRERLNGQCPDVQWRIYYSTLGAYDVVNLLNSEDYEQLMKASRFIQNFHGMKTEIVFATRWEELEGFTNPAVSAGTYCST
ncbi:MAG: GYD domain-containing protein [Pseudomonadales bacterium]